jgi:uncharacterized membrane protein
VSVGAFIGQLDATIVQLALPTLGKAMLVILAVLAGAVSLIRTGTAVDRKRHGAS